jgi:transposase
MCRHSLGFAIPLGVNVAKDRIGTALADPESEVPPALRATLAEMLQEIRLLGQKILGIEHQLNALTRHDVRVQQLRQIPGIGALTSTALRAIVGDIQRFPSGRHFASWLVLTPNERSSAEKRRLGKISKQGDVYLRTLIVHGARSAARCASCRALGTPTRSFTPVDSRLRAPTRPQQGHCRAR